MMITSHTDDKSAPLKNGQSGLGASIGLASALARRLSSTSVASNRRLRLKCDTTHGAREFGRAELVQQNSLFHSHSDHQHLETVKTDTTAATRAPAIAVAAPILSSRLDCVSPSNSEPDNQISIGRHRQAHHHHNQQQQHRQQRTNLVNSGISKVASTRRSCEPAARRSSPSFAVIISSISMLTMLLLCPISESQCNSVPSGFLDSGRAVPCQTGQPVNISDHIPTTNPNLVLCISCTCPSGFVQCGKVQDSPDCMTRPATKFGGASSKATHNEQFVNRPASFHKYKPANRAQPGGGLSHGHSHQPVWAKPNNGKAKAISNDSVSQQQQQQQQQQHQGQQLRKQAYSSAGTGDLSTPIAQPLGGPKQQANKASLGEHFRQLSSNTAAGPGSSSSRINHWSAAPLVRHHQHRAEQDQVDEPDEDEHAGTNDETSGRGANTRFAGAARRHYPQPTARPYLDDLLASPSLPLNDPKHHSLAAAALGFAEPEEYLQVRRKHLQRIADRTSTTPQLITTTVSPTTTTTTTISTTIDEEDSSADTDSVEETDESTTTTTAISDTNPTDGDQELDLTTVKTLIPPTGFTADSQEQQQPGQTTVTGEDGEPKVPFNELTEFTHDPSATETTTTTQQPQPQPQPTPPSQPQTPVFGTDGNAIDHSASNEIMEQVSQDGMLYIAIGVEVTILLTIFAMMIVFYLYREKTTDDDRHRNSEYARSVGQNHLPLPSRSPSIIEKV